MRVALKRDALGQEAAVHQAQKGGSPPELIRLVEPDQIHDPDFNEAFEARHLPSPDPVREDEDEAHDHGDHP